MLIVIALSFVAVTVITKEKNAFEAKPVSRPKMKLKKLQVPVNIEKKKAQKPKLCKRIAVQPKMKQTMPDIVRPPSPIWYQYTPRDIAEGFVMLRDRFKPDELPGKSGLKKRKSKKVDFS